MSIMHKNFCSELKQLLKEYNATIGVNISGDTHGIYDEAFIVQYNDTGEEMTLEKYTLYLTANDL